MISIKVPTVGESISEVTLGAWSVKSGDAVKAGDLLLEIESDKATFELRAEATGIVGSALMLAVTLFKEDA